MIDKFSAGFKMTASEMKVIIFLLLAFATGFILKSVFKVAPNQNIRNFDYSYQDSLFVSIGIIEDSTSSKTEISNKKVDYKREVLDFSERDFKKSKTDPAPSEKSINLNSASVSDLMMLPGVGQKTAESIIEYRNSRGGFRYIKELLEVKGIGTSKLEKIEKFVFIEKKELKPKAPEEK